MQHKFKFSVSSSLEGYPSREDETYMLHLLIELTMRNLLKSITIILLIYPIRVVSQNTLETEMKFLDTRS
jgi:hypothetical protein